MRPASRTGIRYIDCSSRCRMPYGAGVTRALEGDNLESAIVSTRVLRYCVTTEGGSFFNSSVLCRTLSLAIREIRTPCQGCHSAVTSYARHELDNPGSAALNEDSESTVWQYLLLTAKRVVEHQPPIDRGYDYNTDTLWVREEDNGPKEEESARVSRSSAPK
ncbi:uncharacterized protein MYCGRDRAFT_97613 [Zymoseptoria tritici IPO323]|uniref:Uncharacterized protein n=1 Tax=Zymoseptoria tritici (strain CBS 115943 / IPO323) TaxID=336722 RepID=F9XQU6_ZYMTI|nr:uncharacterized protein MYCGRDRAFT_97613 [Zymoseptoria tritici IPO323]EGP82422.1 hypothetical protein MYCGRDRAFT_97613 [Zymoseptoria tritici IPO323]